jgi:hypothetical protein
MFISSNAYRYLRQILSCKVDSGNPLTVLDTRNRSRRNRGQSTLIGTTVSLRGNNKRGSGYRDHNYEMAKTSDGSGSPARCELTV